MEQMRVLVTDAENRKSLALVRALGQRGAYVCAAGPRSSAMSLFSRYASSRVVYPDPSRSPERFVAFMLRHLERERYDVLLPTSDYTVHAISRHRQDFAQRVGVPVPDFDVLQSVHDKAVLLRAAREMGIDTPDTWVPSSREELRELASRLSYPCIMKPRRGAGATGLRRIGSAAELVRAWAAWPTGADLAFDYSLPVIQEYVPGEVHDVSCLFDRGRAVAAHTQVRLKTYPPGAGMGVVDQTTWEPELRNTGLALLRRLGWHGPAQVEFIQDARDGGYVLLEVNGRFWGGLGLSIRSGIDFAYLACLVARGTRPAEAFDYRVGLTYRWIWPQEAMHVARRRDTLAALREFLSFAPGTAYNVNPSDPLPHLTETAELLRELLGRSRCKGLRPDSP